MPSLIMKTNVGMRSIKEKRCVRLLQKSSTIYKKPSATKISKGVAQLDMFVEKFQDGYGASCAELCCGENGNELTVNDCKIIYSGGIPSQNQLPILTESDYDEKVKLTDDSISNLETIFSPLDDTKLSNISKFEEEIGSNKDFHLMELNVENDTTRHYRNCSVSELFISDLITAALPLDGDLIHDDMVEVSPYHDYKCAEPSILFDMGEECSSIPFVEKSTKLVESDGAGQLNFKDGNNGSHHLTFNPGRPCSELSDLLADSDHADDFDPQIYIKNCPELSDVPPNVHPIVNKTDSPSRKLVTLVLDLDETLVHSSLDHCGDADFSFNVFFNLKEHTVYVKQRPHLHTFLERVADMFEVVIFTASQSIYAEQLLDILDPERKLISRRVYRESCVFSDGSYTKDLTVLGIDLAKVAIVDNTPQVFRLQVSNGIPIKSWFSDASDCALISLLPFLETLVDADDVRPIISKRFGNKEIESYSS